MSHSPARGGSWHRGEGEPALEEGNSLPSTWHRCQAVLDTPGGLCQARGAGPAAQAVDGSVQESQLCSHTCSNLIHPTLNQKWSPSCSTRATGTFPCPAPGREARPTVPCQDSALGASRHFFILFLPHYTHREWWSTHHWHNMCTTPWKKGGELFIGIITSSDVSGGIEDLITLFPLKSLF